MRRADGGHSMVIVDPKVAQSRQIRWRSTKRQSDHVFLPKLPFPRHGMTFRRNESGKVRGVDCEVFDHLGLFLWFGLIICMAMTSDQRCPFGRWRLSVTVDFPKVSEMPIGSPHATLWVCPNQDRRNLVWTSMPNVAQSPGDRSNLYSVRYPANLGENGTERGEDQGGQDSRRSESRTSSRSADVDSMRESSRSSITASRSDARARSNAAGNSKPSSTVSPWAP